MISRQKGSTILFISPKGVPTVLIVWAEEHVNNERQARTILEE